MAALIVVLVVLTVAMGVSLIAWWKRRVSTQDRQRSNARVLREFKRLSVREPHRIYERQE